MYTTFSQTIVSLIRIAVFLILSGEVASCTVDMRQKAKESMDRGIINIGHYNRSLH